MKPLRQAVAAALVLSAVTAAPVWSADHRDAPAISELAVADINDVYAFRAPGAPSRLVLAMTVNPVSDPEFAGTYAFSPRVLYRFTIDNTGDAVPEHRIDVVFATLPSGQQTVTARFMPRGTMIRGLATLPTVRSTTPNEPIVVPGPPGSGIRLFAGPRDDPFFFDIVGATRFLAGDPDGFRGEDSFAGLNVSAIVLELPFALVGGGRPDLRIAGFTLERTPEGPGRILDRMGNPAVNTALIPSGLKDRYNRALPHNDEENFADIIVANLEGLGTPPENIETLASVVVPDTLKINANATGGFPNGRRLQDDVIDFVLGLVFGEAASDGVDGNDVPFSNTFPYLAPPHQAP